MSYASRLIHTRQCWCRVITFRL